MFCFSIEEKPYSLASILSKRRGKRELMKTKRTEIGWILFEGKQDDNDRLSSCVRKFYKRQDDLIDSLEEIHQLGTSQDDATRQKIKKEKRHMEWLIRATMIVNCVSDFREKVFVHFSLVILVAISC